MQTRTQMGMHVHFLTPDTGATNVGKRPQGGAAPAKRGSHELPSATPQQARPLNNGHQAAQVALLLGVQGGAQAGGFASSCTRRQDCRKTQQRPMPHLRILGFGVTYVTGGDY